MKNSRHRKKDVYPSKELKKAWHEMDKWQKQHGKISLSDAVKDLKKR